MKSMLFMAIAIRGIFLNGIFLTTNVQSQFSGLNQRTAVDRKLQKLLLIRVQWKYNLDHLAEAEWTLKLYI